MTAPPPDKYFHVEGEASAVPAGTPDDTDLTVEFQGWLGDDLLDLAGDWIVSGRLADALRSSALTGYGLAPVTVTTSDQWALMGHTFELPERWERLVPSGQRRHGDDFAVERTSGLMVSARGLALLRSLRLEQADVVEVTSPVSGSEQEQASTKEARMADLRAQIDERSKLEAVERAERERVKAQADASRDAEIAAAAQRHRAEHPDGFTVTGDIDLARAALGKSVDDQAVVALLALAHEPLDHEVADPARESTSSRTEGFAATFENGELAAVVVYPAWHGPLTRTLVDGVDLGEASAQYLAGALGAPDRSRFGARSHFEYDLDDAVLHFGMLATQVDRIMVLPRQKRGKG